MHDRLVDMRGIIVLATLGVVAGTVAGHRVLRWMPERAFRVSVAVLLALLGAAMIVGGMENR
jgi:uncharacterized membrane protein YfcA